MGRIGYVHRDISTGNVLVVDGGGRLSDLEYAKPFVLPTISSGATTVLMQEKESKTVSSPQLCLAPS
jgi:hypothetical protein